jgi:hypothetical protein
VFIGISGVAFLTIIQVIQQPESLLRLLGQNLARMSSFFINYAMLQAFVNVPLTHLLRIGPVLVSLISSVFATTPRQYAEIHRAPFPLYGFLYPPPMLIFSIGLVYSVISPLVLPVVFLYFVILQGSMTYQFVQVFRKRYESGGCAWPDVFRRLLWSTLLFQLTTAGLLVLKDQRWLGLLVIPCVVGTMVFWRSTDDYYKGQLFHVPLDELVNTECHHDPQPEHREHVNVDRYDELEEQQSILSVQFEASMTLVDGILDEPVLEDYQHPAQSGRLPHLWLPEELEEYREWLESGPMAHRILDTSMVT